MRSSVVLMAVLLLLCAGVAPASDGPWSVELLGGAAFTTEDMGDAELGTGLGFEASVAYRVMQHLDVYGGWDWRHFMADESFAGSDVDVEETGYALGVRFVHPIGTSTLSYIIRAGATYDHIEIENDEGDVVADSEHGLGWEGGVGLDIPLGEDWRVRPMARYRTLSRDIDIEDESTSVDLSYVTLEVGLSRSF